MKNEEQILFPNRNFKIKNIDYFNRVKRFLKCYICNKLFNIPKQCDTCHNIYCEECIYNRTDFCPNGCKNPTYSDDEIALNFLNAIQIKCLDCGQDLEYNNIDNPEKHKKEKCIRDAYKKKSEDLYKQIQRKSQKK